MSTHEPYNKNGLILFIFGTGFVFLFFVYLVVLHPGVKLEENIRDVEVASDGPAFDSSKVAEPWMSSAEMIDHGARVFKTNCALCHGNEGKGDGTGGKGLNPPPRDLVEGKWKLGDDSISHFKVITNGSPGTSMAGFAHIPKADRWALVHFIHSITQNKPKNDDPAKLKEFDASTK